MAESYCEKCNKTMNESQFYTYKSGEKTEICKKCLTMHIDNFNPETFLWLLEKMDVPYIPEEWNVIRDKAFAKDPEKMNGMSVFGKYLSKMKLKQFKNYSWADNEKIKEERELKNKVLSPEEIAEREKMLKEQLENGEISEAQYRTLASTETQNEEFSETVAMRGVDIANNSPQGANNPFNNINDFMSEDDMIDVAADLTDEDKLYLAMKWGRLYKPNEWVELERVYNEMTTSFDIQDADTINTLIFICKTNLKMNQAIDIGDLDGYNKLSRVYESLRKSAKFTAAQNKEQKEDFVDSVGELVSYCEKHGGVIPKYEIKANLDIVDKVIGDLKQYTKSLIFEDKALARQIEDYLKKREIAEQQRRDRIEAEEKGLDAVEIKDEDYIEYFDQIREEQELDKQLLLQGDDE